MTSLLVTEASKEGQMFLEQISCIHYPLYFQKNIVGVRALINSGSEVNTMIPAYVLKLSLKVHSTNVGAQKIDDYILEIFGIVLTSFQMEDTLGRA